MRRMILAVMVLSVGAVAAGPRTGWADDADALLTKGRLEADLGHRVAAAAAFAAVADDEGAPAALRAEALVRLALVRRDAGDARGARQAFERVWREYRSDRNALALLVQAVGDALPGQERWDAVWQQVVVRFGGTRSERPIRVEWPGAERSRRYGGNPINLDLKDRDLMDVFRLIADVSGRNVVVHPGIRGRVTFQAKEIRWDDALDRMLAPNGLAASEVGNVVEIGTPATLPPPRAFVGRPIDVDYESLDLVAALRDVAGQGEYEVDVPPGVQGRVTIRLVGVPWDQAFDLLVRLNGLAWKAADRTIRVGLPTDPTLKAR
jgi:hypothetical protein